MNAASITSSTCSMRPAGKTRDGRAAVSANAPGTLATLTPSSPLAAGTVYTATVAAAVTDASGTALGADSLWSFTTAVAPTVTAQAPGTAACRETVNTTVAATSLKKMNAASITTSTFRLRAAGSTADVPATVTVNAAGTLATLTPSSPLAAGTVYTARIAATVADPAGITLVAPLIWSFTTDVAPTVTAQAPAPGATGVPFNTTVTAACSKTMNAASITTATFRLRAAGSAADVPATVTVNAAGTLATLAPSSPLAAGTVYTVTVTGSVTDVAGTVLGTNVAWSFATRIWIWVRFTPIGGATTSALT